MSSTAVNGYKVSITRVATKPGTSVTMSTTSQYYLYYAVDDGKLYYRGTYEVYEWTNVSYTFVTNKDQMTTNGKYYVLVKNTFYYYWLNGTWHKATE